MSTVYEPSEVKSVRALHDNVIVEEMSFDHRFTSGGIYVPSDDKKLEGVRPRWAKVYAIGPEQKDVAVGQWVLVEHGRWTRGVKITTNGELKTIRRIDTAAIMAISDEPVVDGTMGKPL